MKRLPDRYYELVLEIGQLKEEEQDLIKQEPINLFEVIDIRQQINELQQEVNLIEESIDEIEYRYVVAKEVIDLENPEDEYYFTKEFTTEAEAWIEFETEVEYLKEVFTEPTEMELHDGAFHVKDKDEEVNLVIYIYKVD